MSYVAGICLASFVAPLLISFLCLPWWGRWCRRHGLVDEPGLRKIHQETIPLAGGPAIMTALVVSVACAFLMVHFNILDVDSAGRLAHGFDRRGVQVAAVLVGALSMLVLGCLDDWRELRAGPKFLGQLCIAALVAASGIRITLFVHHVAFSYVVTVLWILAVTNAVNFQDNMNGLCAGLVVIAAAWFGVVAARSEHYLVAGMAFLVAGSTLGFLPHNFPRARAFLGDSGSHLLGFLLSVAAILPHFCSPKHPHKWAVLGPLLILAVPLGDMVWVVWLRWRMGRPFYLGDTNHLSHRLVRLGLTQAAAVLAIWLLGLVCGALALWL